MSSISQILVSNTKWLLIIGIFQKIIVFTMNQMVIAYSSPEVIGQISIQSELLLSTLLFLSREGIRIACLKYNIQSTSTTTVSNQQLLINLSWIPCFLVIILSLFITFARYTSHYFYSTPPPTVPTTITNPEDIPSSNNILFYLYCLAAFIECLGEPFYNYYQNQLYIQGRIQAETTALFVKSTITFYMVAILQWTKLSFGIAQVIYSLVYVIVLIRHVKSFQVHVHNMLTMLAPPTATATTASSSSSSSDQNQEKNKDPLLNHQVFHLPTIGIKDFLPRSVKDDYDEEYYFDYDLCKSAIMIMTSSIFKHALTEADKITLSFFCNNYEQGIYALTNNYGSLIARIFFLPIEDSMRISFSRISSNLRDEIRQHYYSLNNNKNKKLNTKDISSNSLEAHYTSTTPPKSSKEPNNNIDSDSPITIDEDNNNKPILKPLVLTKPTDNNYTLEVANKQISFIEKEKLNLSSLTLIEIHQYYYYNELKQLFLFIIRCMMYFGCIISLFGPYYITIIMSYLLKSQWRVYEVYNTLQYYCYYLLLLGINGITEAFLQSIVDQDSSYWSMNFGLIISFLVFFIVFLYTMVYASYGTCGIVIANCFGMMIRIYWNSYLIYDIFQYPVKEFLEFHGSDNNTQWQKKREEEEEKEKKRKGISGEVNPILQIVPSSSWVVLMVVVKLLLAANYYYFTRYSSQGARESLIYIAVGIVIGVSMLLSSYLMLPRESRQQLIDLVRGKRTVATSVGSKGYSIYGKKD